jgi:2-keto-4-pentenoate hydratase/2-oxohepta-3-ene-1,7-dioic acid hydratase in catechol pathway
MRLVTYKDARGIHPGAVRDEQVVALDSLAPDVLSLIDLGADGLRRAKDTAAAGKGAQPLASVKLLAPIPRPRQNVVCVGLNYVAHAAESAKARGAELKLPEVPVFFTKAVTTVCGPDDEIPLDPNVTTKLDYEVELAFIFGRTAKNVSAANALEYVFGYTVADDISARDLQNRHQQFFKGKSLDNACPLGPWIVTSDEIPDPAGLRVTLRVNGETRQDSHTGDLIFSVPQLIEYLTLGFTVEPGTIVSTGTPSGVGMGFTPPKFLNPGDVVEAEVERIGILRNKVVAA